MKKTKSSSPSDRATMRRGRLTIPKAVRKATDVPEEAIFIVESIGDGFLLLPATETTHLPGDDPGDLTLADVLRGTDAAGRERVGQFSVTGAGHVAAQSRSWYPRRRL
jgi:bifunctional DNA-binding transcriptional regulator/antitoxin component of YhaV-PrlF toxin-antitoxin module